MKSLFRTKKIMIVLHLIVALAQEIMSNGKCYRCKSSKNEYFCSKCGYGFCRICDKRGWISSSCCPNFLICTRCTQYFWEAWCFSCGKICCSNCSKLCGKCDVTTCKECVDLGKGHCCEIQESVSFIM